MNRAIQAALLACLLTGPLMGGEFEFGNDEPTIMMSEGGHLAGIRNRDGTHRDPGFRKHGALFTATMLENVYGLDAGKRRKVGLKRSPTDARALCARCSTRPAAARRRAPLTVPTDSRAVTLPWRAEGA